MRHTRPVYDLVTIGGGSAGLSAVDLALRLGARVALVEKDRIGGDCTWSGCVPSKALLAAAADSRTLTSAGFGPLPFNEAAARVHAARERVYAGESLEVLRAKGVEVFSGQARFLDPNTVEAGDAKITGKRFLIATGARPSIPPIPGLDSVDYVTYRELFDLRELPGRLLVLGGGPIGIEMAQAFSRLGSRVTVVEMSGRILPLEEPEASALVAGRLKEEGVTILTGSRVERVGSLGEKCLVIAGEREITCDTLLVATGRRVDTSGLGLEAAGILVGDRGIVVDRFLRTDAHHIFAAGDVTGSYQFTHFAGRQAAMAVRNALLPALKDAGVPVMAWATFTDPEVARVGMSEEQARIRYGDSVEVAILPFEKVDRALLVGNTEGFVKTVRRKGMLRDGMLGATVVGARAGELIHEWVLACGGKTTLAALADAQHVYPAYSIANQQAAIEILAARYLGGWESNIISSLVRGYLMTAGMMPYAECHVTAPLQSRSRTNPKGCTRRTLGILRRRS